MPTPDNAIPTGNNGSQAVETYLSEFPAPTRSTPDDALRYPNKPPNNDNRGDQNRHHAKRRQILLIGELFMPYDAQQNPQCIFERSGHFRRQPDDDMRKNPPTDERHDEVQRKQSDSLHFTSTVP